jgi:fatty-acid desaturase
MPSVILKSVPKWWRRFDTGNVVGILLIHVLSIGAFFTFSWSGLILCLVFSFLTACLGITLGYHRLFTHRSFQTIKPVEYVLAYLGSLSLQGGPIKWVTTHRLHHKAADKAQDPHNSVKGFLWSHMAWLFYKNPKVTRLIDEGKLAKDLAHDKYMQFLDKYFPLLYVLLAAVLYVAGWSIGGWYLGLSWVLWGCALRTVYTWHTTWLVNSATHYWGYRNYDCPDKSRNTWWVALLTFGEGWHNNHHADQRCAKAGHRWFELDVTYGIIQLMRRLGLAKNVVGKRASLTLQH